MRTAIVTDSTCDLPIDVAAEQDIHVLPTILVMQGKSYFDGINISRQQFYERLPQMTELPTTAAPAIGEFQALYEKLFLAGYEKIISIHISSKLSGVFNAASAAAEAFAGRIQVVDSEQVSMGIGFQAIVAAEAARQGETLEAILGRIDSARQRIRLVAMLDTLEYIRRSGRLSWARATVGYLLSLKPFLEVKDGHVSRLGEARTRQKGFDRLLEILHSFGPLERLAMLHTVAEEDARLLLARAQAKLDQAPLFVSVTPIIGTHVGPKAVGVAALLRAR